jgi:hypothetical protein
MSRTQQLYELQRVEIEAEAVSRRLKEIAARLGESSELKRARQDVVEAGGQLAKCRVHTQDLDLEVRGLDQRIAANEQRLYSGQLHNPKDLTNLQDETTAHKRWHQKKEDELLAAMLAGEDAEAVLCRAQANLARVEEVWQAAQAELLAQQAGLQAHLQQLGEQRATHVAAIPAGELAIYQNLRQRKAGRAVAAVKNGICEGCRMAPPTHQVHQAGVGKELVFCNNCGRILHVE